MFDSHPARWCHGFIFHAFFSLYFSIIQKALSFFGFTNWGCLAKQELFWCHDEYNLLICYRCLTFLFHNLYWSDPLGCSGDLSKSLQAGTSTGKGTLVNIWPIIFSICFVLKGFGHVYNCFGPKWHFKDQSLDNFFRITHTLLVPSIFCSIIVLVIFVSVLGS